MATMTPEQLKVLSALGSASKGSTGANINSSVRENTDNGIDAKCENQYLNVLDVRIGHKDKRVLVFADDGEGFVSPDDAFLRSTTTKRKSFEDGCIGDFQEGLRHSVGFLEPDAFIMASRGEDRRCSLRLNYKDIRNDRENGTIKTKSFEYYHKKTEESIDDLCTQLLGSVVGAGRHTGGKEGHEFLRKLVEDILSLSSWRTGTIIMYVWDDCSTAPAFDLDVLYDLFRKVNYTNRIKSDDYQLKRIFVGDKVIDSTTCESLLGDDSVPRLTQKIWVERMGESYRLVVEYSAGKCEPVVTGYVITTNPTKEPCVTEIPTSSIGDMIRDKEPSFTSEHTCVPKQKRDSKGVMFGWKGRTLGDGPKFYEGPFGKKWDPTKDTKGMGAERTHCISSWIARVDIKDSKSFHMMIAGNLKDREFPWYQSGNTLESLVSNFILSELIGKICYASASQGSGYEKTGVTTHQAWMTISERAIGRIATRCGLKTGKAISPKSTQFIITAKPPNPVTSQQGNTRTMSNTSTPRRQITVHRKSTKSHPGITITLPSLKKTYTLKCPNDNGLPGKLKEYYESVFKEMDDATVAKTIEKECADKTSVLSPVIVKGGVKGLKRE